MFSNKNVYYDPFRPNSIALQGYGLNEIKMKILSYFK